jgi:adenylate kinase family enzyme
MKNIIIGGTVRSGKTTLANLLRDKYNFSKVESDTIVNAFDKVFPEFGITHKNPDLTKEKYQPFLFEILNGFCKDLKFANNITVFPGSQFSPQNLSSYEKLDKYIVVFFRSR